MTELLGIDYPILQGGMGYVGRAELAAAVSNVGGLGILSSTTHRTVQSLREEIQRTRELTQRPFGVNIFLFPLARDLTPEECIEVSLEEGVRIFETSGRSPEPFMTRFREAGAKVIHKCARVRDAVKAESLGVDAVTIVGWECGGHPGPDHVGSILQVPLTVDAVRIPVIAAGGFADARGYLAARALGAEGILMGTRFMATKEARIHPDFKQWMAEQAQPVDTTVIFSSIRDDTRVVRSPAALQILEMEQQGASEQELRRARIGDGRNPLETGDPMAGAMALGQSVGLIQDVPSVADLISGIVEGARRLASQLTTEKPAIP